MSQPTVLFLAIYMKRGFGVSVVINAVCQQLQSLGIKTAVGCLEFDEDFSHLNIQTIEPKAVAVANLARDVGATKVVAHTTPYFETLPGIADEFECWAWEHGDPDPEFFLADRSERRTIVERKAAFVYPRLRGVIAISDFVKSEIGCHDAAVVYNGCDHVPDLGVKQQRPARPLKIGALMRLGEGEAVYKGKSLVLRLKEELDRFGHQIDFEVMGRGSDADAEHFVRDGFAVRLNAPDEEKTDFLRDLDVLVSASLWEGFNLPLVEAQALGTVALAFDTGAHPETTPFVTRSFADMLGLLRKYAGDSQLLLKHSHQSYHYVRQRFRWAEAARQSAAALGLINREPNT